MQRAMLRRFWSFICTVWLAEMDPILEMARDRGLVIIEDCAQAHGALYKGSLWAPSEM